jgi:hypothetical protein
MHVSLLCILLKKTVKIVKNVKIDQIVQTVKTVQIVEMGKYCAKIRVTTVLKFFQRFKFMDGWMDGCW